MSRTRHIQLFLFVIYEERIDELKKRTKAYDDFVVDGYLLLSQSIIIHHPELEFLVENGIKILRPGEVYADLNAAVRQGRTEVVELFLKQDSPGEALLSTVRGKPVLNLYGDAANRVFLKCLMPGTTVYHSDPPINRNFVHNAVSHPIDRNVLMPILFQNPDIGFNHVSAKNFLHFAIETEDWFLVDLLRRYGANVDYSTEGVGFNALLEATGTGSLLKVKFLVSMGYNVNSRDVYGRTSLHVASANDNLAIAEFLLHNGADVHSRCTDLGLMFATPLHFACQRGNHDIIRYLFAFGADVDIIAKRDIFDVSALLLAVELGRLEIIQLVLSHWPDVNLLCNKDAFRFAMGKCHERSKICVDMMINHGFVVDIRDIDCCPVIHGVIYHGYLEFLKMLLALGANPSKIYSTPPMFQYLDSLNGSNFSGRKPLHSAASYAENTMISLALIRSKAKVNAKDACGRTPLHYASDDGMRNNVSLLLKFGAFVNSRDREGKTPLHLACAKGHEEVVSCLIQGGSDVNDKCYSGWTPIYYAAENNHLNIVQLLFDAEARLDIKGQHGQTILHRVAEIGCPGMIELFLKHGLDIDATNDRGETPLHLASNNEQLNAIKILLNFGAHMEIRDREGRTALYRAVLPIAGQCGKKRIEILQFMLDYDIGNFELLAELNIRQKIDRRYFELDRYNYLLDVANTIRRHLMRVSALGLPVRFMDDFQSVPFVQNMLTNNFPSMCLAEAVKLKYQRIGATGLSFYDIVTKNLYEVSCYVTNKHLVHVLEGRSYASQFPIYATLIDAQFQKGLHRRELLTKGLKAFHVFFNQFHVLPIELQEKILDYLSNQDIIMSICAVLAIYKPKLNQIASSS